MDYKQKYLKYKQKYLNLKTQMAGAPEPYCNETNMCLEGVKGKFKYNLHNCTFSGCNCRGFCDKRDDALIDGIEFNVQTRCAYCSHTGLDHNIATFPIKLGSYNYNNKSKNYCDKKTPMENNLKETYDNTARHISVACQEEPDFNDPNIGICNPNKIKIFYGFGDEKNIITQLTQNKEMIARYNKEQMNKI